MELVTTDNVTELTPETTTTRILTVTLKIASTADVDNIVTYLKEQGEVTGVSYYEQTLETQEENTSDKGYIY